jgi:hypothetical protein
VGLLNIVANQERKSARAQERNCAGRKAEDPLFPIVDARRTLAWVNERAGTSVQGHGLWATFAGIAEELVSSALLKPMMNHATAGDVTLGHSVWRRARRHCAPDGRPPQTSSNRRRSSHRTFALFGRAYAADGR